MSNFSKNRGDGPIRKPNAGPHRGSPTVAGRDSDKAPRKFAGKPRPGKPFAGKPFSGKPEAGAAHAGRSRPDKPHAGKSFPAKSFPAKPFPAKSFQAKSFPDKPYADRSRPAEPRASKADARPQASEDNDERIAKVMARAGLCSRRDAEAWIAAGRVEVNGVRLKSPALNVKPSDHITVDGRPLAARERTRLFLFHKPRGLVTTDRDPEERPTIFSALPKELPRVVTIGRLDINTEGLLLLTNDGGLARILELPATGWLRRYRVRAKGTTDQATLDTLSEGITLDGIDYAGIIATLDRAQGANVWLTMTLREGKNREVKRVLEHIGLAVNRLIRVSYGPFQLGELAEGAVEEVKTRVLRDQLGMTLAKEAGVDFVGPVVAPIVTFEERDRRRRARDEVQSFGDRNRPVRAGHPSNRDRGSDAPVQRERGRVEGGRSERGRAEGGRTDRRREEAAPAPRRDRPKPGGHKHVSILRHERAEANEERANPRRHVERAETADRKGRAVTVERIVATRKEGAPASRNGRRFAEGKGAERAGRSFGGKPSSGKSFSGKSFSDKSSGGKFSGGKPSTGRFSSGKPASFGADGPARAGHRGKDFRAGRPPSGPRPSGGRPRGKH